MLLVSTREGGTQSATESDARRKCTLPSAGICGALGHLGFECPETNNQNYKMANARALAAAPTRAVP